MNRIIDKTIIQALSVFAMCSVMHGNTFLVVFYSSIIINALNYYLINREDSSKTFKPNDIKEKIAVGIELLVIVITFFFPPAITILPIVTYDTIRSRNYPGAALIILSLVNIFFTHCWDYRLSLFILIVVIISVMTSINTEIINVIRRDYIKLRDDSSEMNTLLRSKNTELIQARNTEIYNAQLSERNRIAREIHDNVGHTLSRAILQMGALLAIHKEEPIYSELESVRQTLDDAMNNIRSSVHDLHDDSIDVRSNIKQLSEPLKSRFNLHLDIDIGTDTPRPVKYAIIGITKECTSNIMKHSKNTDVDIRLNEHPSMYQLIIHDYNSDESLNNMNSFPKEHTETYNSRNTSGTEILNNTGMGLENIRGRVESVNGKLNISTNNGFRVFVTIPK
jgi:signal transduction histidine kinase